MYIFNNNTLYQGKSLEEILNDKLNKIKKSINDNENLFKYLEENNLDEVFSKKTKQKIQECGKGISFYKKINGSVGINGRFCGSSWCQYCAYAKGVKTTFKLNKKYQEVNNEKKYRSYFLTLTTKNNDALDVQLDKMRGYIAKIRYRLADGRRGKSNGFYSGISGMFYKIELDRTPNSKGNLHLHSVILTKEKIQGRIYQGKNIFNQKLKDERFKISGSEIVNLQEIQGNFLPLAFYIGKSDLVEDKTLFLEIFKAFYGKRRIGYIGDFRKQK